MNNLIRYSISFVLLVLLQVFVLNNIQISGIIVPYAYIFFIIMLPIETSPTLVVALSFVLGFTIDLFTHTLGIHSSACVLIGALRMPILKMLTSYDTLHGEITNIIARNGFEWFLFYVVSITIVHHSCLFILETFSFSNILFTLLRIIGSTIASSAIIFLIGHAMSRKR